LDLEYANTLWSGSPVSDDTRFYWYLSFYTGAVDDDARTDIHGVLCVRPGP
jgi:hypothetical protein